MMIKNLLLTNLQPTLQQLPAVGRVQRSRYRWWQREEHQRAGDGDGRLPWQWWEGAAGRRGAKRIVVVIIVSAWHCFIVRSSEAVIFCNYPFSMTIVPQVCVLCVCAICSMTFFGESNKHWDMCLRDYILIASTCWLLALVTWVVDLFRPCLAGFILVVIVRTPSH